MEVAMANQDFSLYQESCYPSREAAKVGTEWPAWAGKWLSV